MDAPRVSSSTSPLPEAAFSGTSAPIDWAISRLQSKLQKTEQLDDLDLAMISLCKGIKHHEDEDILNRRKHILLEAMKAAGCSEKIATMQIESFRGLSTRLYADVMMRYSLDFQCALRIPNNIYSLNSRVSDFMLNQYQDDNIANGEDCIDAIMFSKLFGTNDPTCVEAIIGPDSTGNAVNVNVLRKYMLTLIISDDFRESPEKQQLFVRLHKLLNDEDGLKTQLESIHGRAQGAQPRKIEGLSIFDRNNPMTTYELRCLAVKTVIIHPARQEPGVGMCFCASAFNYLQMNYPGKAMKLVKEILCDDGINAITESGVPVFAPANCYEKQRECPAYEVLHYALGRTLADAVFLAGYRLADSSASIFCTAMQIIATELPSSGVSSSQLAIDICYDSSAAYIDDSGKLTDESHGALIPHIKVSGRFMDYENALRVISEKISERMIQISRQLDVFNSELDEKQAPTPEIVAALLFTKSELTEQNIVCQQLLGFLEALYYKRISGGSSYCILRSIGIPPDTTVPAILTLEHTFENAEDVFRHWFKVLVRVKEQPRTLVMGKDHGYNLAPTSLPLMHAIKKIKNFPEDPWQAKWSAMRDLMDGIIDDLKTGKLGEVMLIDPNWHGIDAVGFCADGTPPRIAMCFKKVNDQEIYIIQKKHDCFFRDLCVIL
ncbi:MAG: hypothetical protein LBC42_01615 [Puniceicoccales bacterium]|jgi:hypothetical protein|nr:hypothetical protein [Puniceicoccales bacterium]